MGLNAKFLDLYKSKVKDTLMSNYLLVSKKLETSGMEKEIREAVTSAYNNGLSGVNKQQGIKQSSDSEDKFSTEEIPEEKLVILEFLTLSLISGYFHLSNIDINKSSLEGFGFSGCQQCIITLLKSINESLCSEETMEKTAFQALVSAVRDDVNFDKYIEDELYVNDIEHIVKCLEPKTERAFLKEEDEKIILDKVGGMLKKRLTALRTVYETLLADSFGLEKYKGVFVFNNVYGVQGLDSSYGLKTIAPNGVLIKNFAKYLELNFDFYKPNIGVSEGTSPDAICKKYSDRQFDYNVMYQGFLNGGGDGSGKPVYFPHKMLEILNSTQYTTNTHTRVYKPISKGKNLVSYLNYLFGTGGKTYSSDDYDKLPPLAREFLNIFCCGISTKLAEHNRTNGTKLTVSDVFDERDTYDLQGELKVHAGNFANYCFKCFTTCFVLMSIDNKGEHIYDFRIRACYPDNITYDNRSYIANVGADNEYVTEELLASQADNIPLIEVDTEVCSICIQDYSYCSNPKLAYGRPLFAYKALQKMSEQDRDINWDSILLGKSEAGGLITSVSKKRDSGSKINLQDVHMHYLIAGSRSGKGVTGYNILGTALVSGLPVFYLDRKPDTASIMKSISPNMFAVNGGDYQSVFDITKSFEPNSLPFKIPPYLKNFFGNNVELMCDYAYLRGMLFAINLAVFMDKCKAIGNPIWDKLNKQLKDGYFIVLDEFTNFTNQFLQKYIVPFSDNGKAVFNALPKVSTYKDIVKKGFEDMKTSNAKLEKLKAKMDSELSSGKKGSVSDSDVAIIVDKFNDAIEDLSGSAIDLSKLYWNAFYQKYTKIFEGWTSLKKAGAGVMLNTHLFIIGQDLEPILFDSQDLDPSQGKMMFNKSAIDSKSVSQKGVASNLFYKFLNDNPADIILGFQPKDKGKPSYLSQDKNIGSKANSLLTEEKKFFCYGTMLDSNKADIMNKIANTGKVFKSDDEARKFVNGFEYFKPFLILNTSDIPSEEYLYPNPDDHEDTFVSDAYEEERKTMTGSAQYVAQCITSCNKVGITYDDLISDNPDPSNPETLNSLIGFENYMNALISSNGTQSSLMDLLGKSGDIANIVVQEVIGYNGTWEDYIYDFSAEALFSWEDWGRCLNGEDSVQERLKDSFFLPFFVTRSAGNETFASIFKDQLGSLYQYYGDTVSESPMAEGFQREIVIHDEPEDVPTKPEPLEQSVQPQSFERPTNTQSVEDYAEDFYSKSDEPEQKLDEDDEFVFTREMTRKLLEQTFDIYDSMHPGSSVRSLFFDYEIEDFVTKLTDLLNS